MSKAKLTIANAELETLKNSCMLQDVKVLEIQNVGDLNKVQINYKTEQQIFEIGRTMERVKTSVPVVTFQNKKQSLTLKQNQNDKQSKTNKQNKKG